jgi:hypothetical protein
MRQKSKAHRLKPALLKAREVWRNALFKGQRKADNLHDLPWRR